MKTIAEEIKQAEDPYHAAVAKMVWRDASYGDAKVIFHFEDGSTLTFKKVYELED